MQKEEQEQIQVNSQAEKRKPSAMFNIRSRNKAFTSQERQEYGMKIAIVTGASSGMGLSLIHI